jgi:proline racemase
MVDFSRMITTIDSHTAGEGTRLVTGGLPPVPGATMGEKMAWADAHLAWAPGLLLNEPRGHRDLFGAALVPPCASEADIGLLLMDNRGFEPMCGHAVIGTVTTLLEIGMLPSHEPRTQVVVDTPAGIVRAEARLHAGRVTAVSIENVPSFVLHPDLLLDVPELGALRVDIVYGGLFFVFVDARQLDLALIPAEAARLSELGMRLLASANASVQARHPEMTQPQGILDARFYREPGTAGADSRNVVILGDRMVDRSPCGTGTSAETALRHSQGRLGTGESFVAESILGTRFRGEVAAETQVGSGTETCSAVIPRVTGSAHITGFQRFVLTPDDPFAEGFLV